VSATASQSISDSARQHLTGALCICAGALAYNLIDAIIKALSGSYPLSQFLVVRALATLPIVAAMVLWEAGPGGFRIYRAWLVALRGIIFFLGSLAFGLSIATIAIADAVSIYFIMPLAIAGLAGPILGERVPFHRWMAIAAGFIGVLVIMRPGTGVLEWAALLALAGALLESVGQIISRMLPGNRSSAIAF
jgi:drug/metabolite transporter (DMT)-like permease